MGYQNPKHVKSPKDAVTHLRILYDGGEEIGATASDWEGWSVAELEWYEEPVLACRWNGSTNTARGVSEIGNPQSRGHPTWFILPRALEGAVRSALKEAPPATTELGLTEAATAASAPAFAKIWANPEDDVYDAL